MVDTIKFIGKLHEKAVSLSSLDSLRTDLCLLGIHEGSLPIGRETDEIIAGPTLYLSDSMLKTRDAHYK